MKFQPDPASAITINGLGSGWVMVNGQKYTHSILIDSLVGVLAWPVDTPHTVDEQSFAALAQLDIEVALYGSGVSLVFPNPSFLRPLIARNIGLETMNTAAACRTFNILAGEGRKVAAALLVV